LRNPPLGPPKNPFSSLNTNSAPGKQPFFLPPGEQHRTLSDDSWDEGSRFVVCPDIFSWRGFVRHVPGGAHLSAFEFFQDRSRSHFFCPDIPGARFLKTHLFQYVGGRCESSRPCSCSGPLFFYPGSLIDSAFRSYRESPTLALPSGRLSPGLFKRDTLQHLTPCFSLPTGEKNWMFGTISFCTPCPLDNPPINKAVYPSHLIRVWDCGLILCSFRLFWSSSCASWPSLLHAFLTPATLPAVASGSAAILGTSGCSRLRFTRSGSTFFLPFVIQCRVPTRLQGTFSDPFPFPVSVPPNVVRMARVLRDFGKGGCLPPAVLQDKLTRCSTFHKLHERRHLHLLQFFPDGTYKLSPYGSISTEV